MSRAEDLSGRRFGRLTAIARVENTPGGRARWICECDCGGSKAVASAELKKGRTSSCGCLAQEQRVNAARRQCHSHSRSAMPRERKSWYMMLDRCYKPSHKSYHQYGGLGITVCDRWRESFEAFVEDMGRRPAGMSLDRIDPCGNYEPGNCKWSSATEQANNKRNSVIIHHDGKSLTVAQWSRRIGVPYSTLQSRISRGWSVDRALS